MALTEHNVAMRDGINLWVQYTNNNRGKWLVVTHGIGEYSDRHHYMLELLSEQYDILFYDLRGHGRSEGVRGDILDFGEFMQDLGDIIRYLREKLGGVNYSLFGHSMGALITASYMQDYIGSEHYPKKVFLSAPPAGAPGPLGPLGDALTRPMVKGIINLVKGFRYAGFVDINFLSHNPQVAKDYLADKVNIIDLTVRLQFHVAYTFKDVFSRPLNIKCDFRCAIGGDDRLVTTKNITRYFKEVESGLDFKIIPGAYHEMHNEVDEYRLPYFSELISFF